MALGFKIADGYVEVHADYDKRELRVAAQRAADSFDDDFQRQAQRSDSAAAIADGIHRDVDRRRSLFRPAGVSIARGIRDGLVGRGGAAYAAAGFARSFVEAITFGQADIGRIQTKGFAKAFSVLGGLTGAVFATGLILKAAEGITALSPLLLAALSIIPIKFLAKTDKEVKKAVKSFKADWKSFMKDISEPIKPGFLKSLDAIRNRLDVLTPLVRTFFKTIGDALPKLTQGLMGGVYQFFESMLLALPGINAGLKQWGVELPKIGRAMGEFFVTILSDTDLVKKAVQGTSTFIRGLIGVLANLTLGLTYVSASIGNFVRLIQIGFANSILPQWLSGVTAKWGPLKQAILDAWNAFKKFATAEGDEQIVTRFRTLMDRIKAIWGPLKDFLGQVFLLGWNLVKQIWSTYVVPWFETAVMPWLKQQGRNLINAMMDELVNQARIRFAAFVASIPGMLAGLVGAITRPFVESAQAAGRAARELVDRVVTFFRSLPGRARAALSNLWSSISGAFITSARNAGTQARALVDRVVAFLRTLPGRASSAVSRLWSSMAGHFASMVSNAISRGRAMLSGFIAAIQSLPSRAAAVAGRVRGAVTGALAGAGSWLVGAGRSIIQGLANGISSAMGWVTSAARRVASAAVAAARSALGIGSPSKVFAEEVGVPSAQGIAMGLRQQFPDEMRDLRKSLPQLRLPEAAMAGAGAAGGSGGAFSPTVNLYMQPGFYSENAAAKRALTKDVFLALEQYRKDYER